MTNMLGSRRSSNTTQGDFEVCKEAAKQFYITAQKCQANNFADYMADGFYPYAVNIAFACELYMKAIMIHRSQENEFHKGHDLKDLFSYLAAEDAQCIEEAFNKRNQHQQLSDFLTENGTVFVNWRYALEQPVSMNLTGFMLLSEILKDYVEALR